MARSRSKKMRSAAQNGLTRKRRRHRAERREATKDVREKINDQKREIGHPGWVHSRSNRWTW